MRSALGRDVRNVTSDTDLTVHVTGHAFYWQLRYEIGGREIDVANNQLHLPQGKVARVVLDSADVVHGLHPELDARGTAFGAGPDAVASRHAMEKQALGSLYTPKAKTTTEWKGD